jgi:hypothetical protein
MYAHTHFVSLSKNGIEVFIYVNLIAVMLLPFYKKANNQS